MKISRRILVILLMTCMLGSAQQPVRLDHPIHRIQGVVQRENGEPLPNIDVEVYGGKSLVAVARTDSKGKFKTDSVPPGEYEVEFSYKSRPVFQDAIFQVTVDPKGSKEPWVVVLKKL